MCFSSSELHTSLRFKLHRLLHRLAVYFMTPVYPYKSASRLGMFSVFLPSIPGPADLSCTLNIRNPAVLQCALTTPLAEPAFAPAVLFQGCLGMGESIAKHAHRYADITGGKHFSWWFTSRRGSQIEAQSNPSQLSRTDAASHAHQWVANAHCMLWWG